MSKPRTSDKRAKELPPMHVEGFSWTMSARTEIVTATRPSGEQVQSDTKRISVLDQRRMATHSLEWREICELATRAKNAFHFIWLIDQSSIA